MLVYAILYERESTPNDSYSTKKGAAVTMNKTHSQKVKVKDSEGETDQIQINTRNMREFPANTRRQQSSEFPAR